MAALRPRVDFTVVIDGKTHDGHTTLQDTYEVRRRFSDLEKETGASIMDRVVWCACERLGIFVGEFDDWVKAIEDYEVDEPPPLSKG